LKIQSVFTDPLRSLLKRPAEPSTSQAGSAPVAAPMMFGSSRSVAVDAPGGWKRSIGSNRVRITTMTAS
jgi:hypothetical protein